jgi:competence protein ComGC
MPGGAGGGAVGMMATRRGRLGFSLLETLVVLAIVMVLLTFLVPVLTKALRMAKRTAAGEEMHSERVGEVATAVHEGEPEKLTPEQAVLQARESFHHENAAGQKKIVSHLLFAVKNDDEFRAYWYTLLCPANAALPEFNHHGALIAITPEGHRYELPPVRGKETTTTHIVAWDFISTRLEETGRGDLGGNVVYSDTRIEYMPYPRQFPMTQMVAELSHRFYMDVVF